MTFTCKTKALVDALNLGIINANINTYDAKSNLIMLRADKTKLSLNLESSVNDVKTELTINGSGDSDTSSNVFLNNVIFKQLMSTINTDTISLIFEDHGVKIVSGKSEFDLPSDATFVSADALEFNKPNAPKETATELDLHIDDWKYVKEHQVFALANQGDGRINSSAYPMYRYLWVSDSGDVLSGDITTEIFTYTTKGHLANTCLLSGVMLNLLISMPETTKFYNDGNDYYLVYKTEDFEYLTQWVPRFESDTGLGSYNSEVFLNMLEHTSSSIQIDSAALGNLLRQAELLSKQTDTNISFSVSGSTLTVKNSRVKNDFTCVGSSDVDYTISLEIAKFKKIIDTFGGDIIDISPVVVEEAIVGIRLWNEFLTISIPHTTN